MCVEDLKDCQNIWESSWRRKVLVAKKNEPGIGFRTILEGKSCQKRQRAWANEMRCDSCGVSSRVFVTSNSERDRRAQSLFLAHILPYLGLPFLDGESFRRYARETIVSQPEVPRVSIVSSVQRRLTSRWQRRLLRSSLPFSTSCPIHFHDSHVHIQICKFNANCEPVSRCLCVSLSLSFAFPPIWISCVWNSPIGNARAMPHTDIQRVLHTLNVNFVYCPDIIVNVVMRDLSLDFPSWKYQRERSIKFINRIGCSRCRRSPDRILQQIESYSIEVQF